MTVKNWIQDLSKQNCYIVKDEDRSYSVISLRNSRCLKCGSVDRKMVRIGALDFCEHCFVEEFNVEDLKYGSSKYREWLKIYKEEV